MYCLHQETIDDILNAVDTAKLFDRKNIYNIHDGGRKKGHVYLIIVNTNNNCTKCYIAIRKKDGTIVIKK